MKTQEVRGKTMEGADLGFLHLRQRCCHSFAHLLSGKVVAGPENLAQFIIMIGQAKELRPQPLLHLSGSLISKGEGHDLRDRQGTRLPQEEIENAIDQDRGLAGSGSCHHDDIAIPSGLGQEPVLGVCEY
ncbi:MAG: hypothetical protein JW394_0510 [Nitrospira sp.]|nr:hypothetical protein [Nitrospira sp.]